MRQNVQHFAVGWQSNVARGVDRAAHVFAFDVARAMADAHAAAAVDAAHMSAGNANHCGFHGDISDAFGLFHSATNRAHGGVQVYDQALAQPL